jgi:hypothetical protein
MSVEVNARETCHGVSAIGYERCLNTPTSKRSRNGACTPQYVGLVAEQLCLVWNARGAADMAKLEAALYMDGSARYTRALDRALRTLDR